jgi:branched-chain amino acid transport system substrate-binding protein
MKKFILPLFLLSLSFFLFSCGEETCPPLKTDPEKVVVKIAVLVSETGSVSEIGKTTRAGFELAVDDMKSMYAGISQKVDFVYEIVDDQADASNVLTLVKQLHEEKGYNVIFGINTSSAVKAIKQYADQEGIVIVSNSSTSSELAVANDNIYRFVPSDNLMAKAGSKLAEYHELDCVIPVSRNDVANLALSNSLGEYLDIRGIQHPAQVEYDLTSESAASAVEKIRTAIVDALKTYQSNKIGIFLASFEEYIQLFEIFTQEDLFKTVKWYGGDGTFTGLLFANPVALQFAKDVNFCVVTLGNNIYNSAEYDALSKRIKTKTNGLVNPYGITAYDGAVCLIKSMVTSAKNQNATTIKAELVAQSEKYYGISGWCKLNLAGDRSEGFYDFYEIKTDGTNNAWSVFYSYESQYDVLFDTRVIK